VISLSKLQNKYFATRCLDGNLSIWSATAHPDKIFTIYNVDHDENASNLNDTFKDSSTKNDMPINPPPKKEELEDVEEAEEEEGDVDADGSPVKKKVVPPEPIKKER
jgi:hypothetical protein